MRRWASAAPSARASARRAQRAGFTLPRDAVRHLRADRRQHRLVRAHEHGSAPPAGSASAAPLNSLGDRLVLFGPAVKNGQDYRLLTAAFIHYGLLHIGFNMYALYLLGGAFERYAGPRAVRPRLLHGRADGQLRRAHPDAASRRPRARPGAIFGVMGALFVLERQRGHGAPAEPDRRPDPDQPGRSRSASPGISIGGHIGGLIGGAPGGLRAVGYGRSHMAYGRLGPLSLLGIAAIVAASVAGALAVAG